MPAGYYLFWIIQLSLGTLVGVSVAKNAPSLRHGLAVSLLLGTAAIVDLIIIDELRHNRRTGNIVAYVIGGLGFLFPLWAICLLFTCIGYWLGFWLSGRLGVGGWQFGIPTLLAFVAIYAVVAAIGRAM